MLHNDYSFCRIFCLLRPISTLLPQRAEIGTFNQSSSHRHEHSASYKQVKVYYSIAEQAIPEDASRAHCTIRNPNLAAGNRKLCKRSMPPVLQSDSSANQRRQQVAGRGPSSRRDWVILGMPQRVESVAARGEAPRRRLEEKIGVPHTKNSTTIYQTKQQNNHLSNHTTTGHLHTRHRCTTTRGARGSKMMGGRTKATKALVRAAAPTRTTQFCFCCVFPAVVSRDARHYGIPYLDNSEKNK